MSSRPKVINIKDAPEGWQHDPQYVYIGREAPRKHRLKRSIWANPFKIGRDGTREEVIRKYETEMRRRVLSGLMIYLDLTRLSGKTLVCWCKPEPCHGDALVGLWEELSGVLKGRQCHSEVERSEIPPKGNEQSEIGRLQPWNSDKSPSESPEGAKQELGE